MTKYFAFLAGAILFFGFLGGFAQADGATLKRLINDSPNDSTMIQQKTTETTQAAQQQVDDNVIRLTPDRTKIIRLEQNASSVVVTNPVTANISLDSPRTLLIMPRTPGATSFMVLDNEGKVVMEKNIVVTAAQNNYVRIRKSCDPNDAGCQASAYYYCPDGCYQVTPTPYDPNATSPPPLSNNAGPIDVPSRDDVNEGVPQ